MLRPINKTGKGDPVVKEPYRISFNGEKWVLYKRELCANGMWNPLFEHEHFTLVETYLNAFVSKGLEILSPTDVSDVFYDERGSVVAFNHK